MLLDLGHLPFLLLHHLGRRVGPEARIGQLRPGAVEPLALLVELVEPLIRFFVDGLARGLLFFDFGAQLPELQIGLRLIVPITLTLSGIVLFLVQLAVRAQKQRSVTGEAGMIDQVGQALTSIEPGGVGRVQTVGEIWTATADEPIAAGERVQVVGVKGLLLTVRKV